jgi:putative endonuclease
MAVLPFPAMREGRFYKFWVYIIASSTGTLYIGMTGFIDTRIFQHRSGEIDGFTKKYKCNRLVYYEQL